MLTRELATVDETLKVHAVALGPDFVAYRNHVYRVANLCVALSGAEGDAIERISVAAVFHDLGIWTDGTLDYLRPSIALATAHLSQAGASAWIPEVTAMILEHHKVTPYRAPVYSLVEAFRRADLVDLSLGSVTFGLKRPLLRQIVDLWPRAGFHRRLAQLSLQRWRSHPLNPLPMVRL